MGAVVLEWGQYGYFDSFDVIRSGTSMVGVAEADLPSPIATNLKSGYYVDNMVTTGVTYFYKVRVWRAGESLLSDEIEALAKIKVLFTPASLSLELWLDGKDESTLTLDSSNLVSTWRDKSGKARHAVQEDTQKKPVYDSTVKGISAQSSLKALTGAFENPSISEGSKNQYLLFMVAKPTKSNTSLFSQTSSGAEYYVRDSYNSNFFSGEAFTSGDASYGGVGVQFSLTTGAVALTETRNSLAPFYISRGFTVGSTPKIFGISRSAGGSIYSMVNGVSVAGSPTSVQKVGWKKYSIFSQYTSSSVGQGTIYEIILVFDLVDSLENTSRKIEGYLAHKWGLLESLPIDHPYKINPPLE